MLKESLLAVLAHGGADEVRDSLDGAVASRMIRTLADSTRVFNSLVSATARVPRKVRCFANCGNPFVVVRKVPRVGRGGICPPVVFGGASPSLRFEFGMGNSQRIDNVVDIELPISKEGPYPGAGVLERRYKGVANTIVFGRDGLKVDKVAEVIR